MESSLFHSQRRVWMRFLFVLCLATQMWGCRSSENANFGEWLKSEGGLDRVLDVLKDKDTLMETRIRALTALIEDGWVAKEQKRIEETMAWCPNPQDIANRTAESLVGRLSDETPEKDIEIADGLLMLADLVGSAKATRYREAVAEWLFAPLDASSDALVLKETLAARLDPAKYWALGSEGVPYYLRLVKAGVEFETFTLSDMVHVLLGVDDVTVQRRFVSGVLQGESYARSLKAFADVVADESASTAARVRLVRTVAMVGFASQIRTLVKGCPNSQKFASFACNQLIRDLKSTENDIVIAGRDSLFALLPLVAAEEAVGVRAKLSAWAFESVDTSKGPEETWRQLQKRIRPGQVVFLGEAAVPVVLMMLEKRAETPDFTVATMLGFLSDVSKGSFRSQALESYQRGFESTLQLGKDGQVPDLGNLQTALPVEIASIERYGSTDAVVALASIASARPIDPSLRLQALDAIVRLVDSGAMGGEKSVALEHGSIAIVSCLGLAPQGDKATWARNMLTRLAAWLELKPLAESALLMEPGADIPAWVTDPRTTAGGVLVGLTLSMWQKTLTQAQESLVSAEKELDPFGIAFYSDAQKDTWEKAVDAAALETLSGWTRSTMSVTRSLGVLGLRYLGTAQSLTRLEAIGGDPTDISALLGDGLTLGTLGRNSAKAVAYLREHPELSLPLADKRLAERLSSVLGDLAPLREALLAGPYSADEVPSLELKKKYEQVMAKLAAERQALVGLVRAARRAVETTCFEAAKDYPPADQQEALSKFVKDAASACRRTVEKSLGEEALQLASLDDAFYLRSTALGVARWEHLRYYRVQRTARAFVKYTVDTAARNGDLEARLKKVAAWDLQDPELRPVLDLLVRSSLNRAQEEYASSQGANGLSEKDLVQLQSAAEPVQNFAMGAALASMYLLDGYKPGQNTDDVRVAPYLDGLLEFTKAGGPLLGNADVRRFLTARGGDAWFILRELSHRSEANVARTWLLDEVEKAACRTMLAQMTQRIQAPVDAALKAGRITPAIAKEVVDHYPFMDYLLDALFESSAIQAAIKSE